MDTTFTILFVVAIVLAVLILVVFTLIAKKPAKLNQDYFEKRWSELVKYLATSNAMQLAVIDADKLLDEALKKRKYSGKTMGERLVSAQRVLSNNNAIWAAHKLRNRLVHEHTGKVPASEIQNAMRAFRQALRDVGALR